MMQGAIAVVSTPTKIALEHRADAIDLSTRRGGSVRVVLAAMILMCLSSAPYMSTTRWFTDVGLWHTAWPYVYTYWIPALVGGALFVSDVLMPLRGTSPVIRRPVVQAMIVPVGFAGWSLCSAFWAASPTTTPSQALLMTLGLATAAWFGLALPIQAQVVVLFACAQLLTIGSLGSVIFVPSARWSPYVGDRSWIGLFGNPNSLGPIATLAVIATAGMALVLGRRWWTALGGLVAIDLIVAAGATSVTAWLSLIGGIVTLIVVVIASKRGQLYRRFGSRVLTSFAMAALVLTTSLGVRLFAEIVGKDSTLSGRTVIWRYVVDALGSRWPVGFGYGGFWSRPEVQFDYMATSGRGWVMSSHSSFVDTLADLGIVGFAVLVALVTLSVGRIWWCALGSDTLDLAWWTAIGAFALVENLAESMMLSHSLFWFLLVTPGFVAVRLSSRRIDVGDHSAAIGGPDQ